MSETETPSPLDNSILETPVPDSTLFLLYRYNRAYLDGKIARPHLVRPNGNSCGYWLAVVALIYGLLMICSRGEGIWYWLRNIQLPDFSWLPDLPPPSVTVMLLFLSVLFLMGVAVVIRDWRLTRKPTPPEPEATPAKEKAVAVALAAPKGQVLDGTVVRAEKIVSREQDEKIGVRYEFAAPGGVVTQGYAAGKSDDATDSMAPLPGTPVKIYYEGERKFYLL